MDRRDRVGGMTGRGGRSRRSSRRQAPPEPVELTLYGFTHGGEAVGRRPDGKVCFVPHAIPGERVRVQVTDERKSWSRGALVEVLDPSPDRVAPPCPYARPGVCGGCSLQHVRPQRQAELLRQVVVDQLERIGHIDEPPVTGTRRPHPGDGLGYRNRARFSIDRQGRLGFHRQGSDEVVHIDRCPLLTEQAHASRVEAGDEWSGAESVTARADESGHGMIEVVPGAAALPALPAGERSVVLVDAVGAVHALRGSSELQHRVGDATFAVSATSFFQPSVAGAAVLVEEVLAAARVSPGDRVLDLYCGVGLFSHALSEAGATVTAVEAHPVAVADARRNLASEDVDVLEDDAAAVAARFADSTGDPEQTARPFDTVVLDPPRRGAGPELCTDLGRLAPARVVYVACDPAALARDAGSLVGLGFRLTRVVPVDQFTHTGHVEAVATFLRG
jgi:tRNA/tmRNA/rRNA uracil-C5-methylase (TrmA/RlmC/RlmD family)